MHVSEFRFDKQKYYFVGLNTDPRNGTIKLINTSRGPFGPWSALYPHTCRGMRGNGRTFEAS